MTNITQVLQSQFGHSDLYQLFQIEPTATDSEIKKAYFKLALIHHPDKGGDKDKFQALSLAHSILSDAEKRRIYDSDGLDGVDENDSSSNQEEDFEFWYNYFRALFPAIKLEDIDNFKIKYVGSEEEQNDIIAAYQKYDGDLVKVMEHIMFAEAGEEERILTLVETLITGHMLEETKKFTKTKKVLLVAVEKHRKKQQQKSTGKRKRKTKVADEETVEEAIEEAEGNESVQEGAAKSSIASLEEMIRVRNASRMQQQEAMFERIAEEQEIKRNKKKKNEESLNVQQKKSSRSKR
jgi:DnaJ homolog subfamily C member 9